MGRIDKEHTAEAFVDGPLDRQASIDLPKQVERLTLTTTPAQERYREKVRDLMRAAHEKSVFGDIPFSDAKFDRAFDNTLHASGNTSGWWSPWGTVC
ncbi:hypothetical protein [uncultured Roseobacter sp.]|uniref:hypothetical protein n=1 Tax=uncultured Roseobacter sp. TaxID=114847 RepID=UPI00262F4FB3|nr:hypothetical protein [uncultured Roseobacter sp.]